MKHLYEATFDVDKFKMEQKVKEIETNLVFQYTNKGQFNFEKFIDKVCAREHFFNVNPKNSSRYSNLSVNFDDEFLEVLRDDMIWEIKQLFIKYHDYYKTAVLNVIVKYIEGNVEIYLEYLKEYEVPDFIKDSPELEHYKDANKYNL